MFINLFVYTCIFHGYGGQGVEVCQVPSLPEEYEDLFCLSLKRTIVFLKREVKVFRWVRYMDLRRSHVVWTRIPREITILLTFLVSLFIKLWVRVNLRVFWKSSCPYLLRSDLSDLVYGFKNCEYIVVYRCS